jgi:hypothetical protein
MGGLGTGWMVDGGVHNRHDARSGIPVFEIISWGSRVDTPPHSNNKTSNPFLDIFSQLNPTKT